MLRILDLAGITEAGYLDEYGDAVSRVRRRQHALNKATSAAVKAAKKLKRSVKKRKALRKTHRQARIDMIKSL